MREENMLRMFTGLTNFILLFSVSWYSYLYNVDCPRGFFGWNCKSTCPFGFYGQFCKYSCMCNASECHHVTGCEMTTGKIQCVTKPFLFLWFFIYTNKKVSYSALTKFLKNVIFLHRLAYTDLVFQSTYW